MRMGITNLNQFCDGYHALLESKPDMTNLIGTGRSLLGELIAHRDWFVDILQKILFDQKFMEDQKSGIWPNEITLYRSPDRSFVILCYIWGPYVRDIVHDHGSWGIIGSFFQPIAERKYTRLDDGKVEGHAELKEVCSHVIGPGGTTYVLPLEKGIHKMENLSNDLAITINVYGRSIRKGYINFFYPETNFASRIYMPGALRQALAIRALGSLRTPWSKEMLKRVLAGGFPEHIKKEAEMSLDILKMKNSRRRCRISLNKGGSDV